MKNLKNEEILKMIESMTVKEVVELIESLEEEHNIPQESNEVKQDDFLVLPNYKVKGTHSKPFYQKGRW